MIRGPRQTCECSTMSRTGAVARSTVAAAPAPMHMDRESAALSSLGAEVRRRRCCRDTRPSRQRLATSTTEAAPVVRSSGVGGARTPASASPRNGQGIGSRFLPLASLLAGADRSRRSSWLTFALASPRLCRRARLAATAARRDTDTGGSPQAGRQRWTRCCCASRPSLTSWASNSRLMP